MRKSIFKRVGFFILLVGNYSPIQSASLFRTLATGLTLFAVSGDRYKSGVSASNAPGRHLLASQGDPLFIQSFGGGYDDVGTSVEIANDGSFLIAGYTATVNGGSTYSGLAMKHNTDGSIAYAKAFGDGTSSDYLYGISETLDGGIALMGYGASSSYSSANSVIAMKLYNDWTINWAKIIDFYRSDREDVIYAGTATSDGGMVMGGRTEESDDGLIVKLGVNGEYLWGKYLSVGNILRIRSVVETGIGGFVIAGHYTSGSIGKNGMVAKLSSSGGIAWVKQICCREYLYAAAPLINGDFGVAGYTTYHGAGADDLIVGRLDNYGNLLWLLAVGGTDDDQGYAITGTQDDGLVVGGTSSSFDSIFGYAFSAFVVKVDKNANVVWSKIIGGGDDDTILSIKEIDNGQIVLTGDTRGIGAGQGDVLLVKLAADGSVIESCSSIVDVTPAVANISGVISFSTPTYTYGERVPISINDWNITIREAIGFMNQHSVCESTPTPTTTTSAPTFVVPTIYPTTNPTEFPTEATPKPTQYPTPEPTNTPTKNPTTAPSLPTKTPTMSPTNNVAPVVINPIPTQYAIVGYIFDFSIPSDTFLDGDGDILTLSVTLANDGSLPSWLNYVSATQRLIGTPTLNDVANLIIKVVATDPQNASVTDLFGIVVKGETDQPTADPTVMTVDTSNPSTSPLAVSTMTRKIGTTFSPTKKPAQDSSSQSTSSNGTKDPMFILVICLGTGLFCFCGSVVFYCCFVNKKLEYSLQTMNKSVEEGKDMKSATQNVQNELQTLKTKEDTL